MSAVNCTTSSKCSVTKSKDLCIYKDPSNNPSPPEPEETGCEKCEKNVERCRLCRIHLSNDDLLQSKPGVATLFLNKSALPRLLDLPDRVKIKVKPRLQKSLTNSEDGEGAKEGTKTPDSSVFLVCMKKPKGHMNKPMMSSSATGKKLITPEIKLRKKLKSLQQKLRRKNKKIETMNHLIDILNTNGLSDEKLERILKKSVEGLSLDVPRPKRYQKRKRDSRPFTQEVKKFASILYRHSPHAYDFIRRSFCLPHPSVIKKWAEQIALSSG